MMLYFSNNAKQTTKNKLQISTWNQIHFILLETFAKQTEAETTMSLLTFLWMPEDVLKWFQVN